MTYQSTLAKRLEESVQAMLKSNPSKTDQKKVRYWLKPESDGSGTTQKATRPPSGTAPPVVIGWLGQAVLSETFKVADFPDGVLGPLGDGIINALGNPWLITQNVSGAQTLIGASGTVHVFESNFYETVNLGSGDQIADALDKANTPKLADHDPLVVAWTFQSLVVVDPIATAPEGTVALTKLGKALRELLEAAQPGL